MKLPNIQALGRRVGKFLSDYEKVLLAVLSVIIVISGTVWYKSFSKTQNGQPSVGGTYIEGVVGGKDEAQAIAAKITKAGLFTIDQNGDLQNLLITSYTANADKSVYDFNLLPDIDGNEIKNALNDNSDFFSNAVVTLAGTDLKMTLAQPNPDIPLLLTEPIFDYGPYTLSKLSDTTTILTRNTRAHAANAYLNKIVIMTYKNEDDLKQAIKRGKVDGATLNDSSFTASGFTSQTISFPEYYVLMFNQNVLPFKDSAYRHKVIANDNTANKPFTLTVANQEPYLTLANNLVATWKAAGIPVTLDARDVNEIQQSIAPSRNFQAILTGVNYGGEYDPYYIWSSTQIRPPGNNLTGVKDDQIDANITQIQQTANILQRQSLILSLHQLLGSQNVAEVLSQQKTNILVSDNFSFVAPQTAMTPLDKWLSVGLWWGK